MMEDRFLNILTIAGIFACIFLYFLIIRDLIKAHEKARTEAIPEQQTNEGEQAHSTTEQPQPADL